MLVAAACGPDESLPSDGVIRVTNMGTPPVWRLDLVASMGAGALSTAAGPEDFGRVVAVALGADDEVFVADRLNWEVRVFGLDGSHRWSFGRRGQGPGEFESLYSIAWVGDRLLALDYANARISEFSAAGDHLGQRETATQGVSGSGLRLYPVSPEEVYADDFLPEHDFDHFYVGHGPEGPTDIAISKLPQPEEPASHIVCTAEDRKLFYSIPFAPSLVQHPGPGGLLYSAMTNAYRIAVTQGADTVRVIEREAEPAPLSAAEWEAASEGIRNFRSENPGVPCEPDLPGRPSVKPIVKTLFVAPDGRLWVDVAAADGNWWEVFAADGDLLARIEAPASRGIPALGAEHVVTIRRDSLDLDYVDVYRIERPDGS